MTEEAAATSKEPAPVTMANATSSSVLETQMTTVIQREEFTTTLAAPAEVTSNVTATEELSTITIEGEPAPFVKKNSTAAALSTPEITSEAEPKSSTTTSVAPEKITSDNNTTEQPVTRSSTDIDLAVKHAGDGYNLFIFPIDDFYRCINDASRLYDNCVGCCRCYYDRGAGNY
ncbi:hypothetical protein QR680_011538 [Steinernema hermaphroditum]|uniref:Uncharacterized protein n=1 Tax=Steinernema hermaphroditum TaxID=289476 RepID=A0AA39LZ51_9BILA|nr:hypothetical protein QR680_011538 [Steinernema hermaphroditum]